MTHAGGHPGSGAGAASGGEPHLPRLIAWEVTRSCPLNCRHCRASAGRGPFSNELSTAECRKLLDNIASFARPVIILTGGEPMLRPDIYDIAAHARELGLRVVMAPCGGMVNDASARRIVAAGISMISLSLDGARASTHDAFRGRDGSFQACLDAVESARSAGLDFQVNSTVTRLNIDELGDLLDLAVKLGAKAFNPFLLVPTGRGRDLLDMELSPELYERTLHWLAARQGRGDIHIRVTCAPHYQRILRQMGQSHGAGHGGGCMGGKSFAFVSHVGKVQICGFLGVECGDLRADGFDFRRIWETSPVFLQVRSEDGYHGRCGRCEFRKVCGGCRARAYALTGDYLGEEPFCTYQPRPGAEDKPAGQSLGEEITPAQRRILAIIQDDFPIDRRPFDVLARRLGTTSAQVLAEVASMAAGGLIRRIGAVFDSRRLGYVSTLVAVKAPPAHLDTIAAMASALPGVTHNYARGHAYNLWFTLTAPDAADLASALRYLRERSGLADIHSLPALAVYKSRVVLSMDEPPEAPLRGQASPSRKAKPRLRLSVAAVALDEGQKAMVRLLQGNLPPVEAPFDSLAAEANIDTDALLEQLRTWLAQGVVRRFGAVLAHRKAGFTANGMAVFAVPPGRLDAAGRRLARERAISHVYARPTMPDWPYNLFAMTHGRDEREVRALIAALAAELRLDDWDILFSTKEYKKESMRFFV